MNNSIDRLGLALGVLSSHLSQRINNIVQGGPIHWLPTVGRLVLLLNLHPARFGHFDEKEMQAQPFINRLSRPRQQQVLHQSVVLVLVMLELLVGSKMQIKERLVRSKLFCHL